MDFTKGEVYFQKADGRRLVYLGLDGNKHKFVYASFKSDHYVRDWLEECEIDTKPMTTYKMWSLE